MEKRSSNFEDHLSIVESGHQKVASKVLGKQDQTSLLAKLAAELGSEEKPAESTGSAPVAEGEKELAGKDVTTASPEVVSAMDGVMNPQVAVAGGVPAAQAAGMEAHMTAPIGDSPVIATGEETATNAANLNKTPEAVAAAARDVGGAQSGSTDDKEAEKIGQLIAKSFQAEMQKQASDQEYAEALSYLKSNDVLAGYDIKDEGISKTASFKEGALEKIANKQALTREDIVNAAIEYSELQKTAAVAEEQGRADAHAVVEFVAAIQNGSDQEKIASLMQDEGVVNAIKVLKSKNLL